MSSTHEALRETLKVAKPSARIAPRRDPGIMPSISLALQGGGAHGAFTWGVLDELLAAARFDFEGLSGSSAGALNAVVLADGWLRGGREGARQALQAFWTAVGEQMPAFMVQATGDSYALSPTSKVLTQWASLFTPAQLNPLALNPLRDLLQQQVDFDRLRGHSPFKLFVGATHARTGRLRVFRESELTVDVLLASTCLPTLHLPVEIDGEAYWDGGYSANPAIFPLFYGCDTPDVLLVLMTGLLRQELPRTPGEIEERLLDLQFNASFVREMQTFSRAAAFAAQDSGGPLEQKLRQMRFHIIDPGHAPHMKRMATQLLAHGPYLAQLHHTGVSNARAWLNADAGKVGAEPGVDLLERFG